MVGAGLVPALKAWDSRFVMRVLYEVMRKTIFPRSGVLTTAKSSKKFATDRFDRYLTRSARDGMLLSEV
jgi:hypothetical protein